MGRHFKKISIADAQSVSRSHGNQTITCADCPKFKDGYCCVFAKFVSSRQRACKYGKIILRAVRQSSRWRKRK